MLEIQNVDLSPIFPISPKTPKSDQHNSIYSLNRVKRLLYAKLSRQNSVLNFKLNFHHDIIEIDLDVRIRLANIF